MNKPIDLTKHHRHARLVKLVRRWYQKTHLGSKLFNNTTGTGWTANEKEFNNGVLILTGYRPLSSGIPAVKEGGGGTDLLGMTLSYIWETEYPILTGIECKTGNAKLKPNQKNFKAWLKSVNGLHYTAVECDQCWSEWDTVKKGGQIVEWIPKKSCPKCKGIGFLLEE
jgi:hypothetical protein